MHLYALLFTVLFAVTSAVVEPAVLKMERHSGTKHQQKGFRLRFVEILLSVLIMSCAWCYLYTHHWDFFYYFDEFSLALGVVVVGLQCSLECMLCIFFVDLLDTYGIIRGRTTIRIMNVLGVLIGLVWEKAFHEATHTVAVGMAVKTGGTKEGSLWVTFVLALFLVILVVPGWRMHLLPKSLHAQEKEQEAVEREMADQESEWEEDSEERDAFVPTYEA